MKLFSITVMIFLFPLTLLISDSFAETVLIPEGTSLPDCEKTNQCYNPYEVTIDVGDKVTWKNGDSAAHTVTSGTPSIGPDDKFDSSLIMPGDEFSHKFEESGTFNYFCMVHPWMEGIVIVRLSSTSESQIQLTQSKTTPRSELITAHAVFQKISNVLSNTDYYLDEKATIKLDDSIKEGYGLFDPEGETIGGVNIWSKNDYIKRLEIATRHFNDFDTASISTIILAGLVKGVMDSNEYDIDLFTMMLEEATANEDATRILPSGDKVTVSWITIVEGTPGLTMMIFDIEYNQNIPDSSQQDIQTTPSDFQTTKTKTPSVIASENQMETANDIQNDSTNVAIGAFIVLGIPAIIIGIFIVRHKMKKSKIQKIKDAEWKGV